EGGNRITGEDREELVAAVEAVRQRPIGLVGEGLVAIFKRRFEPHIVPQERGGLAPDAPGVEVLVSPSPERHFVPDHIGLERRGVHPGQRLLEIEPRPGRRFDDPEVEPLDSAVMVDIGGAAKFEGVALLVAQIVAVKNRTGAEHYVILAFTEPRLQIDAATVWETDDT